jgi:hypothetical protein
MDLIGNQQLDLDLAADAVAGSLAAAVIDLFQSDTVVDRNTVVGDLVVADYSGYAQKVITWLAPSISDDGQIEVIGTVTEWRPTSSAVVNSIYGLLVRAAGVGPPLYFVARFDDAPLPMGGTLDSIILTLRWRPRTGGLVATVS